MKEAIAIHTNNKQLIEQLNLSPETWDGFIVFDNEKAEETTKMLAANKKKECELLEQEQKILYEEHVRNNQWSFESCIEFLQFWIDKFEEMKKDWPVPSVALSIKNLQRKTVMTHVVNNEYGQQCKDEVVAYLLSKGWDFDLSISDEEFDDNYKKEYLKISSEQKTKEDHANI